MDFKGLKPGNKVVRKNGNVVMTIQRYAKLYNSLVGWHTDKNFVICTWYDKDKGRIEEIIHQRHLVKVKSRDIPDVKLYTRPNY